MLSLLSGAVLGLLLGLRHAFEPDHLLAVGTLLAERRRHGWVLGATWGLGHTFSLFLVGGTLALLETHLPERVAASFEAAVGLMLVVLGARAILRAYRETRGGPTVTHPHHGVIHHHPGTPEHVHLGRLAFSPRPLFVGILHGLAGSGALTSLVLAELPTLRARLSYIAVFGAGSMVGMAAMTWAAGAPLQRLRRLTSSTVLGLAGACSGLFGAYWMATSLSVVLA